MRIVAHEDAAAVAVKSGGYAKTAEQALQQVKIAFSRFGKEELRHEDFTAGVVLHPESGETRTATFEPVVRAAVELHELAFASDAHTALAMSGSAAFTWRAATFLAQHAAEGLATKGKTFDLVEFFTEVMIVETGIFGAGETHDGLPH